LCYNTPKIMKPSFLDVIKERVLVLDGAMGTNLQRQGLTPADFGGKDGCNEYLVLTKPEAIEKVHASFFEAGCDAVETNTFGANRIVLAEYSLSDRVMELNQKAAQLARRVADRYTSADRPRFVVGSVGPTTKLPSLGHIGFDEMRDSYREQVSGLLRGGVDAILIETCQDLLQAKIAVIAVNELFEEAGKRLPLMVQVTFEKTGTMLLGTEMGAVVNTLEALSVDCIGMNCATGPLEMSEPLRELCETSSKIISALPNAGLPENIGGTAHYRLAPKDFGEFHERFVKEFGVSIVGGCCGTTPEHLQAVAERVKGLKPKQRTVRREPGCASLFSAVTYEQKPAPLLVGERTNANGSKKFKELLQRNDFDTMISMGREAVKEGAHVIDVSVAFVGRDEKKDMAEVLSRFNQQVPLPVMIDSTEWQVTEEALKHLGGKPIINSVNLEDGGSRMRKICALAKKYGAALIALTIDEKGMAKTADEKIRIAKRILQLATAEYGIRAEDIFFDTLTFTLGSGDQEFRAAAAETLEAIGRVKREIPDAKTILGVSNVSYGFHPEARQVLNSVFLHDAIERGLDAAIVHVQKIIPLFKIPENEIRLCRNLIHNDWGKENRDPVQAFLAYFEEKKGSGKKEESRKPATGVEEALKEKIIEGNREGLEAELDRALKTYSPLEIVNQLLLEGMKTVGELFGAGKMQLPFVLQSAEVMKKAVAYLEPFMEKKSDSVKGTMVLATVRGDVHDIGKNLVDIILSNNGYRVINLGIKQPVENVLKAAEEHKADAIGLSGLLVKSTLVMKEDLEEMNRRGISLPVICGGAALTRRYVEEDLGGLYQGEVYYGQDAFSGLRIMEKLTTPGRISKATRVIQARGVRKENIPDEDQADSFPSGVSHDNPVPVPPFYGYKILKNIRPDQIYPWINTTALLKGQWQFRRGRLTEAQYGKVMKEKAEPLFEEMKARCVREKILEPRAVYGFWPCYSEGDALVVLDESGQNEAGKFVFPRQAGGRRLCLADFFRPKDSGTKDVVAFQLVTMGPRATEECEKLFKADRYADYLYLHGLSVEAAEACAEYLHKLIRQDLGIHSLDAETPEEIFRQGYRGSRYSFGYPACPRLEDQAKLFKILPAGKIGVTLTEAFQLVPEQSTSALIAHHPGAKYFNID